MHPAALSRGDFAAGRKRAGACVGYIGSGAVELLCEALVHSRRSGRKKLTWYLTGTSWKALAEKFEKENPNVDIVMIYGDMDKFYTMTTAGPMPDVWGPWGTPGIHADVNRNWAVEVTAYLKRDEKSMDAE